MTTHRADVSGRFGTPATSPATIASRRLTFDAPAAPNVSGLLTVDMTVTEWVADLSIPVSSTRTTNPSTATAGTSSVTSLTALGYVDYDSLETIHSRSQPGEPGER